jgi:hypothetical protein
LTIQLEPPDDQYQTKACRICQRVSTSGQNLSRQHQLVVDANAAGFYVAGVYSEKVSGTVGEPSRVEPPDLRPAKGRRSHRRVARPDQPCRWPKVKPWIAHIAEKGAKIAVPNLIDVSTIIASATEPLVQIVLEAN